MQTSSEYFYIVIVMKYLLDVQLSLKKFVQIENYYKIKYIISIVLLL